MGIHGIYQEIGPGVRIALSKFAAQKFKQNGRPLRLAIDTSIWLFQIQSSKGGTNPALRTFFYRLLRLMSLSIHPLFVFDGPNKPPFKRNKRTGASVASIPEFLAQLLLKQFGFPFHLAPGEAEAECALLQREGIVDAVLSEDVDTLMFGSGVTLRNWSPEGREKTPSHVNVYDAKTTSSGPNGLDKEGMILVAMMSGGDYCPNGIPKCGPKTACEAARAGFGRELCAIPKTDTLAFQGLRERLQHELTTNESNFFRIKHSSLKIPDEFPNLQVLGYYTNPAVSSKKKIEQLRSDLRWDLDIDFAELRKFTIDAFKWTQLGGAKHFIRNLAPPLLVRELRLRGRLSEPHSHDDAVENDEMQPILSVHGSRNHVSTDGLTELRVGYIPHRLVPIDLDAEDPDDEFPQEVLDDEEMADGLEDDGDAGLPLATQAQARAPTKFNPTAPARMWIPEIYVKNSVPSKVQDWEESIQKKEQIAAARAARKPGPKPATKKANSGGMIRGALDKYAVTKKPGVPRPVRGKSSELDGSSCESESLPIISGSAGPPCPSRPTRLGITQRQRSLSQLDIVSLLSPSPPRRKDSDPSSSLAGPTATKRRRRSPLRKAQTLPASLTLPKATQKQAAGRPATPPMVTHLDLTLNRSSPSSLPSPSQAARLKRPKVSLPHKQSPCGSSKTSQGAVDVVRSPRDGAIHEYFPRVKKHTPRNNIKPSETASVLSLLPEDQAPNPSPLRIHRVQIWNDTAVQAEAIVGAIAEIDLRTASSRTACPLKEISGNEQRRRKSAVAAPKTAKETSTYEKSTKKPEKQYIQLGIAEEGFWGTSSTRISMDSGPKKAKNGMGRGRRQRAWPLEDIDVIDLTVPS